MKKETYTELLQSFIDIRSALLDSTFYKKDSLLIKAMDLQIKKASK
mgnify:CR=1 FL=1|tara:strand:+ start:32 stop:169 length:138 start_codon:yes stop_codon:yes gene_type:complete